MTVRGTMLLNTVAFVRHRFGPGAHERVLSALPPELAAVFVAPLHEGAWKPAEALVAYMETARALLAPADDAFFREMGRFAGRHDREQRAFGVMLSDLHTATMMASVLWRTYFDQGRIEIVARDLAGATLRIHEFPARRCLCQRICGSIEGQQGDRDARVQESSCVLDGAACCELRVSWGRGEKQMPADRHA